MPGQKLWLWALSREGGVWEELLTDTDGQYVEFQAGRLFVQYSPGDDVNPITQARFDPMSASRWSETWFPLEGIGGLTDASRDGAMHVAVEDGQLDVERDRVPCRHRHSANLGGRRARGGDPRGAGPIGSACTATVDLAGADRYRVQLVELGLDYDSDPSARLLSRPFSTDASAVPSIPEADRQVFQARELLKGRQVRPGSRALPGGSGGRALAPRGAAGHGGPLLPGRLVRRRPGIREPSPSARRLRRGSQLPGGYAVPCRRPDRRRARRLRMGRPIHGLSLRSLCPAGRVDDRKRELRRSRTIRAARDRLRPPQHPRMESAGRHRSKDQGTQYSSPRRFRSYGPSILCTTSPSPRSTCRLRPQQPPRHSSPHLEASIRTRACWSWPWDTSTSGWQRTHSRF